MDRTITKFITKRPPFGMQPQQSDESATRKDKPGKLVQALIRACDTKESVQSGSDEPCEQRTSINPVKKSDAKPLPLQSAPPATTLRVLVVDDDSGIRRSLARILVREGYSPITTGDGRAVVDLCMRMRPTLIFLDLSMPNFNGPQVLKALKSKMGEDYPPVIWITGSVTPENLKNMGGAVACLPNPLDIAKIREILGRNPPPKALIPNESKLYGT
jgi:CheY-like chemotaxis protein